MNIDKEDVGIAGGILTFILLIFRGGRAIENIAGRVKVLEDRPEAMTIKLCDERREGCKALNTLQFDHGTEMFGAMEKMIEKLEQKGDERERKNDERHKEVMAILRGIKK